MSCVTRVGPDKLCGHSDEDHLGIPDTTQAPCEKCGCPNYTTARERCPNCESGIKQPAGSCAHVWHGIAISEPCPMTEEDAQDDAARQAGYPFGGVRRGGYSSGSWNAVREAIQGIRDLGLGDDISTMADSLENKIDDAHPYEPESSKVIQKWADKAMFTAEPIDVNEGPKVYLLWMTPDPLAAIAASSKMYKGEVARSLRDVTHAERQEFVKEILKTKLQAPLEFVKFHFLIEGVTRAFTHQMVRQRTAVYAQESLRFAVKEDMPVGLPPSLAGTEATKVGHGATRHDDEAQRMRIKWDRANRSVQRAYSELIEAGMPAEDARGLLPHNTLTRLHYSTDLRALLDHAGNRLCTQAQFEWRLVFAKIAEAIRNYNPYAQLSEWAKNVGSVGEGGIVDTFIEHCTETDRWQYELLADLFRPVCYATGKCEFKANFDRACSIRNRVDANENIGRVSVHWGEEYDAVQSNPIVSGVSPQSVVRDESGSPVFIGAIKPAEWLLDPGAAR